MRAELRDRFGKMPPEVEHFLAAIEIKILAARLYARRIIIKTQKLKLFFDAKAQDDEQFFARVIPTLMQQKRAAVRFMDQEDLAVEIGLKGDNRMATLDFAKIFLHSITGNN